MRNGEVPLSVALCSPLPSESVRNADTWLISRKILDIARDQQKRVRLGRCPNNCVRKLDPMLLTNVDRPGGNQFINSNNAKSVKPRPKLLFSFGRGTNHDLHPGDQTDRTRFVSCHLGFCGFDLVQIVNENAGVKESVYHSERNLSW